MHMIWALTNKESYLFLSWNSVPTSRQHGSLTAVQYPILQDVEMVPLPFKSWALAPVAIKVKGSSPESLFRTKFPGLNGAPEIGHLRSKIMIMIKIIITLFQEDNIFGMKASLTYGPQI